MPITESTHLTTRESQDSLKFQSLDGTSAFLRRNGVVPDRRGRFLLWPRKQVLALVQRSAETSTKKGAQS